MKTCRVFISGFVQGVGFRRFVRSKAEMLGLTGWVRNLPDRRVEVIAQGAKEKIEQLIKECKKGSFLSEVEDLDVQWEEIEEKFDTFDISKA